MHHLWSAQVSISVASTSPSGKRSQIALPWTCKYKGVTHCIIDNCLCMFHPVDGVGVALGNCLLLLDSTTPFLFDVCKLVVRMKY